jgi:hypothetical protein
VGAQVEYHPTRNQNIGDEDGAEPRWTIVMEMPWPGTSQSEQAYYKVFHFLHIHNSAKKEPMAEWDERSIRHDLDSWTSFPSNAEKLKDTRSLLVILNDADPKTAMIKAIDPSSAPSQACAQFLHVV